MRFVVVHKNGEEIYITYRTSRLMSTTTTTTKKKTVELDPSSCSKIFSHALKHPHSDVSGLLLTSEEDDDKDDDKDAKKTMMMMMSSAFWMRFRVP